MSQKTLSWENLQEARKVVKEYVDRAIVTWRPVEDNPEEDEAVFDPKWHWQPGSMKVKFQTAKGAWVTQKMNRPTLLRLANLGCLNSTATAKIRKWEAERKGENGGE
jgi:hypothetical protein